MKDNLWFIYNVISKNNILCNSELGFFLNGEYWELRQNFQANIDKGEVKYKSKQTHFYEPFQCLI